MDKVYNFGTVSERDMDMLFLNTFGTDKSFLQLFISKTDLPEAEYEVKEIYLSKADKDGESDITVVVESEGKKIGILVEDKIDAIAMPRQPERYIKRGENGIKNKDYEVYYSFIACPKKYYSNNEEAKKYPYCVMYEEIRDYLKEKNDPVYRIYYEEISQAIEKAKRPPRVEIDEKANYFFRGYKDYQEANYPELNLRTKRESNGYWAQYTTGFGAVYLLHKIIDGKVDLTFNKAAHNMDELSLVADWLRKHEIVNATATVTGKSGAIRVMVPKLNMHIPFDENDEYDIEVCFKTISALIDAVKIFRVASEVSNLSNNM